MQLILRLRFCIRGSVSGGYSIIAVIIDIFTQAIDRICIIVPILDGIRAGAVIRDACYTQTHSIYRQAG